MNVEIAARTIGGVPSVPITRAARQLPAPAAALTVHVIIGMSGGLLRHMHMYAIQTEEAVCKLLANIKIHILIVEVCSPSFVLALVLVLVLDFD